MKLGIAGQVIERVSLDYAVTLLTDDGAEIRIETAFSLRTLSGEILVNPERLGEGAKATSLILHEMIVSATASDDVGALVLDLTDGIRLEVAPHDSFEAWTFTRSDGFKLVAQPGGGLSTWAPNL